MADVELRIRSSTATATSSLRAYKQELRDTRHEAGQLGVTVKQARAEMEAAAREAVADSMKQIHALRDQIAVQREVTASYRQGSTERKVATVQEIELQHKLARATGESAAAAGHAARSHKALHAETAFLRGATSSSHLLHTGMAAFAGLGFIAGAVAGTVLERSVHEAEKRQVAEANLRNALKDSNIAWAKNREEILKTLAANERLTGFEKTDQEEALSRLVRSTGNLSKAQRELSDMENIARARHTDLQGAMMLVLRAAQGNAGALRRLGIEAHAVTTHMDAVRKAHLQNNVELVKHAKALDLAASKQKILAEVEQRYAGAGGAYMKTFAGRVQEVKNTFQDLSAELGKAAIPKLTTLFEWIQKEADAAHHSAAVHKALRDAADLISTAWTGLKTIVEGVHSLMQHKLIRTLTLVTVALWALDAAALANPWVTLAAAAILAVGIIRKHWEPIAGFFKRMWDDVVAAARLAWDAMKLGALNAVLMIIEPFSHLPGSMGKWARDLKDTLHAEWQGITGDARKQFGILGGDAGKSMYQNFAPWAQRVADAATAAAGTAAGAGSGGGIQAAGTGAAGAGRAGGQLGGGNFQQSNIVATARSQKGIPYLYGGAAILGHPTDCAGLAQAVLRQNGISVGRSSEQQWTQGTPVKWGDLQPGDLVFFDTHDKDKPPSHVGIYIGDGSFIHDPHTGASVTVANLSQDYWHRNYMGARRYVKVSTAPGAGSGTGDGRRKRDGAATAADKAFQQQLDQAAAAAAAAKAGKRGLKQSGLTTLEGAITAELKTIPQTLDPVEKDAIAHIQKLRDSLHVGMSPEELAKARVELARWGKVLKDEIHKNAREAAKAARDAAALAREALKHYQAAVAEGAKAAAAAWKNTWSTDQRLIERFVTQQWDAQMRVFDRETSDHLKQMARSTSDQIAAMQRDFQQQMTLFDRETQKHLAGLAAPAETPTEMLLRQRSEAQQAKQLQDALTAAQATGDPVQIAQAQYDLETVALEKQAKLERDAADKAAQAAQDAYQQQRDDLKTALTEQESVREKAIQDQADAAAQAYQDQRDAQKTAMQNMHDDQVIQFAGDLTQWATWIATKQKTWADFLLWLQANPLSKGFDGSAITNPNVDPSVIAAASEGALQSAYASGIDAATAALLARGAGMNAKYGLGAYAPPHAAGGIHWRPSVGMLGDQGPEATFPLSGQQGQAAIQALADAVARAGGGSGGGPTFVNPVFLGATERQLGRALEGLVTPAQARTVRYRAPR